MLMQPTSRVTAQTEDVIGGNLRFCNGGGIRVKSEGGYYQQSLPDQHHILKINTIFILDEILRDKKPRTYDDYLSRLVDAATKFGPFH